MNIIIETKSIVAYLKKHPNADLNKLVQEYSYISEISIDQLDYVDAIIGFLIKGIPANTIIESIT